MKGSSDSADSVDSVDSVDLVDSAFDAPLYGLVVSGFKNQSGFIFDRKVNLVVITIKCGFLPSSFQA